LAASRAALEDQDFVSSCRIANAAGLRYFEECVESLNIEYISSSANFITLNVGDGNAAFEAMQRDGIIVRPLAPYGMGQWIRVSVGTEEQNELAIKSLTSFLSR
jgi:histidinol-phosphate aminotransferase